MAFDAVRRGLSLYIHWPFCLRRCRYCSFVSTTDYSLEQPYLEALLGEIRETGRIYAPSVDTVYLGGGTPSAGSDDSIGRILRTVHDSFRVADEAEITIEANPSSVTSDKLRTWKGSGVSRVSMGLQAGQNTLLHMLGRLHTMEGFEKAYDQVRAAGFDNVSIDLMYGLPLQSRSDWIDTLSRAAALAPEHISAYCLSLEQGTALQEDVRAGRLPAPDEDLQAVMYEDAADCLHAYGYQHYEISNFSLPGFACRHNVRYWTDRNYLGLGAAAHSRIGQFRFANTASIDGYIAERDDGRLHYKTWTLLDEFDELEEFLMLRTRLAEGFTEREYAQRFHASVHDMHQRGLSKCLEEGLVRISSGRIQPTRRGFLFQNRLALHLVEDIPGRDVLVDVQGGQ